MEGHRFSRAFESNGSVAIKDAGEAQSQCQQTFLREYDARHAGLLHWLGVLMEREPKTLQTIASHKGSQQGVHLDSIHMTTYPLGYLAATWIAFEDIHPDSGPLVCYPGSHRPPFVFTF